MFEITIASIIMAVVVSLRLFKKRRLYSILIGIGYSLVWSIHIHTIHACMPDGIRTKRRSCSIWALIPEWNVWKESIMSFCSLSINVCWFFIIIHFCLSSTPLWWFGWQVRLRIGKADGEMHLRKVLDISVNPGDWEVATPRIWTGGLWGVAGGRGRVVKYYYSHFYTWNMFESGEFSKKRTFSP